MFRKGYLADFLGTFTDVKFRPMSGLDRAAVGGRKLTTDLPKLGGGENGEGWFEAVNWIAAAREARERFVMISLGAHYGAQLVGAHHMVAARQSLALHAGRGRGRAGKLCLDFGAHARQWHRSQRPLARA